MTETRDCKACYSTHDYDDYKTEPSKDAVVLFYSCSQCDVDGHITQYRDENGGVTDESASGEFFFPPNTPGP